MSSYKPIMKNKYTKYNVVNFNAIRFIPTLEDIPENKIIEKFTTRDINDSIVDIYKSNMTIFITDEISYLENINSYLPYLIEIKNINFEKSPRLSDIVNDSNELKFKILGYRKNNYSSITHSYKLSKLVKFMYEFHCPIYNCTLIKENYNWIHPLLNCTINIINYNSYDNFDFVINYVKIVRGIPLDRKYSLVKKIKQLSRRKMSLRLNSSITKTVLFDIYLCIKNNPLIYKYVSNYNIKPMEISVYILSLLKCSNDIFYKFILLTQMNNCDYLSRLIDNVNIKFNFETLDYIIQNKKTFK